jgi:hypothetical protein
LSAFLTVCPDGVKGQQGRKVVDDWGLWGEEWRVVARPRRRKAAGVPIGAQQRDLLL